MIRRRSHEEINKNVNFLKVLALKLNIKTPVSVLMVMILIFQPLLVMKRPS